jgi:predicted esterase
VFHDGAFWKRWWEKNKGNYPEEVQKIKIPDFPKTASGKSHDPFPENTETLDGILEYLCNLFEPQNQKKIGRYTSGNFSEIARAIEQYNDPKAIPYLIGCIDADNSYETVYHLGYFGLSRLSGVEVQYSPFHDGAFWRRWWEKNKNKFPEEVQKIQIPDLPKTKHGKTYVYYPAEMETLDGLLQYLRSCFVPENKEKLKTGTTIIFHDLAKATAKFDDPKAIPYWIAAFEAIDAMGANNLHHHVTTDMNRGMETLTGARSPSYTGKWWREWWEENKKNYPEAVQNIPIPSVYDEWKIPNLDKEAALWREKKAEAELRASEEQWRIREEQMLKEIAEPDSDVADVPCERLHVEGNEKMRYFLIGVDKDKVVPESGYRLVVVMPGGNGGVLFHPFVRRIWLYAMDEADEKPSKFIIAQPVAVRWTADQQIVWATENDKVTKQEFSTEKYVESVIADVSKRVKVDAKNVFTLSWSSSGPAAYAIALQEKTAVTGSYILMSVFKPEQLPPLAKAKGRFFAIQHSPDDRVCPFRMAKDAEKQLTENGAVVKFTEYNGGHGWQGNAFGLIRENLDWLVEQSRNL